MIHRALKIEIFLSEGSSALSFRLNMECERGGKLHHFHCFIFWKKGLGSLSFCVNKILPSTVQTKSCKSSEANMHVNCTRRYSLMISAQSVPHSFEVVHKVFSIVKSSRVNQ